MTSTKDIRGIAADDEGRGGRRGVRLRRSGGDAFIGRDHSSSSIELIPDMDRFLSEMRALSSLPGNGPATVTVARWEGAPDTPPLQEQLTKPPNAASPA